jgi:hypothetical protein
MGYLGYKLAHGGVAQVTGDSAQYKYLLANKFKIVRGELPFDRQ